jgi:hypothetical protein
MAKSRKPIEVWGLGSGGVNLVKSPMHLDDNELIQAQNAEPYRDRGQSGVRKRPAWRPINTGATAAISGIISVELAASGAGDSLISDGTTTDIPASGTKGLVLVARNTHPATAAWKYTTDGGTTWSTTTALSRNIANNDHSAIVYHGRAFYAGESDNIGQILCFDGQREFEFCRLPFGPSAATTGGTDMNAVGFAMGQFYISLNNGTTGRVFQVDPVTGAASLMGGSFTTANEIVVDVAAYAGRVWICTNNDNTKTAHIYSIRPGIDIAWTTERTTPDLGGSKFRNYNSLAAKDGYLYAATSAPAGFAATIEKRAPDGTWTTELTAGVSVSLGYYDALTVWNGLLYAQFGYSTTTFTVVKQASIGSWTTDKDMAAAGATSTGYFLTTPDLLFASGPPRVFTKNIAGSWSTSLSDASLTHGMLI